MQSSFDQLSSSQENQPVAYRMANRSYFCHQCSTQFRQMVNLMDLDDVHCSSCGSDFVEEAASVQSTSSPSVQSPTAATQLRT